MLKKDALDHFGGPIAVARALDISNTAVWKWGEVVPWFSAVELERLSAGAVKVRPEMYVRGRPIAPAQVVNH